MLYTVHDFIKTFKKELLKELRVKIVEDPMMNIHNPDDISNIVDLCDVVADKYRKTLNAICGKMIDRYNNISLIDVFLVNRSSKRRSIEHNLVLTNVADITRSSWNQLLRSINYTDIIIKIACNNQSDILESNAKCTFVGKNNKISIESIANFISNKLRIEDFISNSEATNKLFKIAGEYLDYIEHYMNSRGIMLDKRTNTIDVSYERLYFNIILLYKKLSYSFVFNFNIANDINMIRSYIDDKHNTINRFLDEYHPYITYANIKENGNSFAINKNNLSDYIYLINNVIDLFDYMLKSNDYLRNIITFYYENYAKPVAMGDIVFNKLNEYIDNPNLTMPDVLTYFKYITNADVNKAIIEPVCSIYK